MKFSILHTSARPDKWEAVYHAWRDAAADPSNVQYILVCDRRWGFTELPEFFHDQDKAVWNTGRRCYVDGVNIAAAYATGDVVIVNADDQFPCEHWDTELASAMAGSDPSTDSFVVEVATNTPAEHERGILVMPILSRARYEKLGYVVYPAYESMYADNDFCEMAKRDQCIIDARRLVFPHKHPIFDPSQPWDAAYAAQNRQEAYDRGLTILTKRREVNFGPIETGSLKAPAKRTIALVLPGETFAQAWVGNVVDMVTKLSVNYDVHIQFGFTSNVYFTRQSMADALTQEKKRPDFIFWMDDDQIATPQQLDLLIQDLDDHPELDGVVGWAWCSGNYYGYGPMMSCGYLASDGKIKRFSLETLMEGPDELKEIAFSGFPAVLMRGSTIEKAQPRAFMPVLDEEQFPPYGMSGEDAGFFCRAREKGLKFAVDRRVKVPHLKLGCAEPLDVPVPAQAM
jgi:hypothetical protein